MFTKVVKMEVQIFLFEHLQPGYVPSDAQVALPFCTPATASGFGKPSVVIDHNFGKMSLVFGCIAADLSN